MVRIIERRGGVSPHPVGPAHGLALDLHVVQFRAGVDHGRIGGVCGHQGQGAVLVVHPLEGGFLADAHRGDLAVLHLGLDADIHHVPVMDAGTLHAVAVAGEGEIAPDVLRHVHDFSMFCWARMGVPQAIEPTSGIFFILGIGSNPFGMGRGAGAGWERSASIGTS